MSPASYERIYSVVKRIPVGRVATYGQVAEMAGMPGRARQVGYALHSLSEDSTVPWQRVINAKGKVSARADPQFACLQRQLLENEGVDIDDSGEISLERYRWKPPSTLTHRF